MKRILLIFSLTIILCGVQGQTLSSAVVSKSDKELARQMEILLSVYRDANLFYVDSTSPQTIAENAIEGMLSKLDPYTEYIPAEDMSEFAFQTTGKYAGIGALIRQRGMGAMSWVEIAEPYEGTPSDKAGLKAGDRLLEIDGMNLQGLGSPKVSSMLKGDPDTKFMLKYRPIADTNTTKTVEIIRRRITVPSVPYYGMLDGGIGYIRLNVFIDGSAREVREALVKLKEGGKLKGVILDLRGNGGGIVGDAVDIVGLFVPRGTEVLKIKGKLAQTSATYTTRNEPVDLNLPLAVMVNSSSASASEIVAGALQDMDRAVIIGARTFGKGLVQSTRPVPYNGMLKITTAKYYTPSGRCIQALDYTHRREDGSVGHIPDSLIRIYTTRAGRKVYDGGGIMPDVKLEPKYMSKFAAVLTAYGYIDDFANIYAAKNNKSKEEFKADNKVYDQFVKFMADKEITYESLSSRKLKEFIEAAKREKYNDKVAAEIELIASKIKDNKMEDLKTFQSEIEELLTIAVLTRWSYAHGAIEVSIKDDLDVAQAITLMEDKAQYQRILAEQDTEKN